MVEKAKGEIMEEIKVARTVLMNIIFPLRGEGENQQVLLGIKTRKIGVGLYNGFGGKVELGETMFVSAANEFSKEAGVTALPESFVKVAEGNFYTHKNDGGVTLFKCDILFISEFKGEPKDSEEMENLQWFTFSDLPLAHMMPGDRFWIPKVLRGENIRVTVHYNEDRTKLLQNAFIEHIDI